MFTQSDYSISGTNDPLDLMEECYRRGWTDGLPVVPPTPDLVARFIDQTKFTNNHIIGELPERRREITVEKVAANAVMAGCKPEYFPVVISACEAILDPKFNLVGPSSSLGGAGILLIINGPLVTDLGINCRNNLFGPGNRANATIGRAIRLILMNACAAIPGLFDRSVFGHPGKYSFCIAESEESPWGQMHVERGFDDTDSTVTAFACEGPRQVRTSGSPDVILNTISDVASSLGTSAATVGSTADTRSIIRRGEVAIVISGEARIWKNYDKDKVKLILYEGTRRNLRDIKIANALGEPEEGDENTFIQLLDDPEDIILIFAGGEEKTMGAVLPSWGPKVSSTSITTLIPRIS